MDLRIYSEMPYSDNPVMRDELMQDFLLHNALAHKMVANTFFMSGQSIRVYPLERIGDIEDWLSVHDMIHQQELTNLGLVGQNLRLDSVDFDDEKQFRDWMYFHGLLHQEVNAALGI